MIDSPKHFSLDSDDRHSARVSLVMGDRNWSVDISAALSSVHAQKIKKSTSSMVSQSSRPASKTT
jgi:hypothetical protein